MRTLCLLRRLDAELLGDVARGVGRAVERLVEEVAGAEVPRLDLVELGLDLGADVHALRAARMEAGFVGLGTSPDRMTLSWMRPALMRGMALSRPLVYGWHGLSYSLSLGASSMELPRYMTSTVSAMCLTTARSWLMKM